MKNSGKVSSMIFFLHKLVKGTKMEILDHLSLDPLNMDRISFATFTSVISDVKWTFPINPAFAKSD